MAKKGFFDKSDLKFVAVNVVLALLIGIGILIALIAYLRRYTEHGVEVEVADGNGSAVDAGRTGPGIGRYRLNLFGQSAVWHDC